MTRQRARVAALVAGCAVVAGGAFAATGALSSPAPAAASAAQPAGAGATSAGESAQAAALSSVIADAGTSPGTTLAKRAVQLRRARVALRRLRLLGGEWGQFTIHTKKGTRSLAFERGTIVSVAGDDVTVRAADGTTWTWLLTGSSVVRQDGSRASSSALSAGEGVFVGGAATGTARDARLIVIRKPAASAKSGTASTS
jgi:hypothetical protein